MEALQPYEVNITAKIKAIVGYTTVLLDNNSMKCKLGECNLGNLITDAYVDYVSIRPTTYNSKTLYSKPDVRSSDLFCRFNIHYS